MYIGLEDIDWGSLQHANGSAEDVPGWVRGLGDPDPEVRRESLDAIGEAFDDQGSIYDATVAVLPYLIEVVATPGPAGRQRIAELLTSIAEAGEGSAETELSEYDRDDEDWVEMHRQTGRAYALIMDAAPDLIGLSGDPDARVRAVAPKLLLAAAVTDLADLLINVLRTEDDPGVRRSLLDTLGRLRLDDDAITYLLSLGRSAPASNALAALIAVARTDPQRVPLDDVPILIGHAYAEADPVFEPAAQQASPRESLHEKRRAPHCARLLEDLTGPLGPRVAERTAIITPLLSSPYDDLAGDALYAGYQLISQWRGDYREAVTRTAELLDRSQPFAERAATMLEDWGPLAAPAVETVAEHLADLDARPWRDGRPAWNRTGRKLHPYLGILTNLGDERALPLLLTALRQQQRPDNIGFGLARYTGHAELITAEIVPRLPVMKAGDQVPFEWSSLQHALRAFGPAAAPAVARLLGSRLDDDSAATLGRIGPAAAEALPALRKAAVSGYPYLAVAAAGALWRIDRSPDALALLTARLNGPAAGNALEEIADMGSPAASAAPLVATYLNAPDPHWWTPAHAALTLWRLTGETERVVPVLAAAWHGNLYTRTTIAEAATGRLATALQPLFRAESGADRRFSASADLAASARVPLDEHLLKLCQALAGSDG
ncbi:hypothetical protein [Actinoplanes sp. M2I2]|uniref:hypothetical protein n=1 Tax=Actinoplanes sp. M2I2 TaxID=1734444 RepID=UPI00201FD46E|nr:hypothetical protein [Actinoplanes sp. M2I2]